MTKVVFFRRGERIVSFTCEGHAGDMPEGENIVCAAVSALAQTTVIGVTEVVGQKAKFEVDEERAFLSLEPNDPQDERVQTLLKTLLEGLRCIQNQYPGSVRIIYRERR